MTRALIIIAVFVVLTAVPTVHAQPLQPGHIIVQGRSSATVTTSHVRLGDIADISINNLRQDEAVIGLKKIVIAQSPSPGRSLMVTGEEIVNRLRADGVNLSQVGYVFPREITITRAGRPLMEHEAWNAIDQLLDQRGKDVTIREVTIPRDSLVAPAIAEVKAVDMQMNKPGQLTARLAARSTDGETKEVTVQARVEEFKRMPVAARSIPRGEVIEPQDVVMARLNVAALPRDVSEDSTKIIGLQVSEDIPPGEVFRARSLDIPIIVKTGQRVTIMVRSRLLEVTAAGEALEDGAQGQIIKVRNLDSKRTVVGTVIDSGLVEVRP